MTMKPSVNRRDFLSYAGLATAGILLWPRGARATGKRVALLFTGSIADGGWSQLAYLGLMDLQAKGFDTAYAEAVPLSRIPEVARGYADDGYDLVIGHGYEFGNALSEIAGDYPDQLFFATTFKFEGGAQPNLQFINLGFTALGYAAGALAALISQQGKTVGFVGGGDNPTQHAINAAFVAAAQATVPGMRGLGVVTGSYDNASLGKEAALTMIGNGADVIFHAGNVTGQGAIRGAAGAGVRIIGCFADQTTLAPSLMATSFVINLRWMIGELGMQLANGSFKGGNEWMPTLKEMWIPGYDKARFNSAIVSDKARGQFEVIYEQLTAGTIDLTPFQKV